MIRVSNKATIGKSELVLSIIPPIVRNMPYLNLYDIEYPSGTEAEPKVRPEPMLRMATTAPTALRVIEVTEGDVMNADCTIISVAPRIDEESGRMFVALPHSVQQGAKP
ncbi:Uncharacterized protein ToN1_27410 [Aromatoleum petrolei]|nr:Uncharacterized protein ToN1_27410 [Aromatoleum petrolei]